MTDTPEEFRCPKCNVDISGIIFDKNYFTPTDGGPPSTVGGFIQEGWIEGVQRCDCGYEWEISG
jgi:hypothetical protein